MKLPEFLFECTPDAIRLTGSRIGLEHVIAPFKEGRSPEMIFQELDGPSLALIYKVIAFYLENRDEIDNYLERVAAIEARNEAEHPPSTAMIEMRRQAEERRKVRLEAS